MTEPTNGLDQYDELIRRLYLTERMSDAEVAATLPVQISASGIYHYRTRHGIKGHRRGAKSSLDAHKDEVIRLYVEEKLTDSQIAQQFEVNAETVRKARVRWGIATNKHKASGRYSASARLEEIREQLPAAWERSKRWHPRQQRMMGSAIRVAEDLDVSIAAVRQGLAELGLIESRSAHGEEAPSNALALFDSGLSVPATAREMGIPEDTVRAWISERRDLSNPGARRSQEERLAFRRTVSAAKAKSVAGSGRYSYNGIRLDSTYEVRFVRALDRLGVSWAVWDRAEQGVCEVDVDGHLVHYAPDFLVDGNGVEVKGIFDSLAAIKVRTWRESKGQLAMIMKDELLAIEEARDDSDALSTLQAAIYLDPPVDPAYWD